MTDHGSVTGVVGHANGIQRFGERTYLVELDQDRVGYTHFDAFLQKRRVGHKNVVADELNFSAQFIGLMLPAGPVGFGHAVLDADNRVFLNEPLIELNHLLGGAFGLVALLEHVALFGGVIKLACGRIERNAHIFAGLVAGLGNGLDDDI